MNEKRKASHDSLTTANDVTHSLTTESDVASFINEAIGFMLIKRYDVTNSS
jgi:uncharacterized membrane protein